MNVREGFWIKKYSRGKKWYPLEHLIPTSLGEEKDKACATREVCFVTRTDGDDAADVRLCA